MVLLNSYAISLIVAIAVILVIALAISIILGVKKNKGHVKVDQEFVANIISYLGNKENISSVAVDNARLKVLVNNLDLVNTAELHKLSEKGVFITGNNVKMMFKYDSVTIKKEIEKNI